MPGTKTIPPLSLDVPFLRIAVLKQTAAAYVTLSWRNLASLTIDIPMTGIYSILRQATQLIYCFLHLWDDGQA
ncbi:hypothetical protein R3P38DRAFT_3198514 [Favolaschia claudopus]|uniref:Uncharacterized protein n=1 Tax=Favolaschia claudopus TaxID=2862362 RepID=A0AAW0B2Y8_9AGAR